MTDQSAPPSRSRVERERDLYRRLLALGEEAQLDAFLRDALGLVVEVAEAQQGYIELYDDEAGGTPRWWTAHGLSPEQIDGVRAAISRGIIAEAIATGETIVTPSALLDPRFSARESVQRAAIEAVLCTPIGSDPPRGVLYLQAADRADLFSPDDRACVELVARHLAPLVDRVLDAKGRAAADDPTAAVRASLRLDGLVGHSPALAALLRRAAMVVPLDVTVLLTGASGTGKSQLARLIHVNGPRARHPFVDLNCATLQTELIVSELFGAEPGAHSTAFRRIPGKVEAAEHGTLFLDEVADLPMEAQGKLLQLLQERRYAPLGGVPRNADVRVIAATNVDLDRAVAERRFREDLYYRLQVLPIRVPSLEERREDIAPLIEHFIEEVAERHRLARLPLSPAARRAATVAPWPGNVRQLCNAVESALIIACNEGAAAIEPQHLFPDEAGGMRDGQAVSFQEATRRFQSDLLRRTLAETNWNVVETARRLDLARSHVYNLIRAFGLTRHGA